MKPKSFAINNLDFYNLLKLNRHLSKIISICKMIEMLHDRLRFWNFFHVFNHPLKMELKRILYVLFGLLNG